MNPRAGFWNARDVLHDFFVNGDAMATIACRYKTTPHVIEEICRAASIGVEMIRREHLRDLRRARKSPVAPPTSPIPIAPRDDYRNVATRIAEYLRAAGVPLRAPDIHRQFNEVGLPTIHTYLSKLRAAGIIDRVGPGTYRASRQADTPVVPDGK